MVLTLEDMGFEIEASHHEVAPAQHEIDFKYDEALITADNIMTFKLAVKTIAKRHGLLCELYAKAEGMVSTGSGMHVNMSLFKDGKNIFVDEKDKLGLSREAYYFIGGIMKHMKGMTAITNPLVNSYKRMVPGFEAPISYRVVRNEPESVDPDPGIERGIHQSGTAQPGSGSQSVSCACNLPCSRTGWNPWKDRAAGRCA